MKKVLIAEDDRMVADLLVTVIARRRLMTRLVDNVEEGRKVLKDEGKIDLLVSDVGLVGPGNGLDLISTAKVLQPQIRSICISGRHDMERDALRAGFDIFIGKPPRIRDIDSALRDLGII